jgi:lipopolysaccharide heptosyltransferase II
MPERRILVIEWAYFGDTLMVTPLLRYLGQMKGGAAFDVLVRPSSADALRGHPLVSEVLLWPPRAPARQLYGLIRDLSGRGYSEVWVLHRSFRAALVAALAGIPIRIGYATEARSFLLTHSYPYHPQIHRAENHLSLASAVLGKPFRPLPLEFFIPASAEPPAFLPDRPYFVVNPNASWETKRWLPEHFAGFARRMREETGWLPVMIGSEADRAIVAGVVSDVGAPCLNLAGMTSWLDLAFLLRDARMVLTNDSGPMHLAVALRAPTVALFGPTSPNRTGPYPPGSALVLRNLVPCSPCYLKKCPPKYEFQCMRGLSPEAVVSAVLEYLARHQEVRNP